MKFKIDENLPVEVAELLRQANHDAATVVEQHLAGSTDSDVASVCQQEERALLTLDTDFADIRAYPPDEFHGLIVLRLKQQNVSNVLSVCTRLIQMLSEQPLRKRLWIVEEERVRIRG